MTLQEFQESLSSDNPPMGITPALTGLWWAARGDWDRAHEAVQEAKGRDGSWVHAHLHRKEGDRENASGWYQRAGEIYCNTSLHEEWIAIARELLGEQAGVN